MTAKNEHEVITLKDGRRVVVLVHGKTGLLVEEVSADGSGETFTVTPEEYA